MTAFLTILVLPYSITKHIVWISESQDSKKSFSAHFVNNTNYATENSAKTNDFDYATSVNTSHVLWLGHVCTQACIAFFATEAMNDLSAKVFMSTVGIQNLTKL